MHRFNLEKVRRISVTDFQEVNASVAEIARCLAMNPKFIMLDRPFAGVDPIAVEGYSTYCLAFEIPVISGDSYHLP